MTHSTKNAALAPHPAYSTVLNMIDSQPSVVSTWNTSTVAWKNESKLAR
eukprot:CAMPEP_0197586808 /NCGR_PEP_ID=MMETSP1326-20131121/8661_1 /TAXON_ID=1155430 /ORGANISM="Genus nov. species nov., Strain RCC2288" /LENGTH=48 /DNA_ID= /DNA_START= /DNA_END= /DNA_ORIENTATION=